ncbi:TRAP-type mannitol/chloroaromatic compound transport system permease small subunit [Rhodopseudomonas thermotolerans]|jgi:TRAP-type mannitol/chloroaromatic compound transport system permease small subunit|uniref:TRAP transporter small permease protein n=2 Tax=Rhodopseudomonas TaxID=1073 RepID=A0A336JMZ4_9BRAD|nr:MULTISPECIES: TRAP transporter small permease subunit [Rhodopseudomonas]RED42079.1 TRAP-type mannitol/chloroaromatic compound transport system permease small subunit [Rhodopseudomonas pentothenatexigens]REG07540.1 TRAP-type mannitol/chloroaromatic compound transport system permease small subunit [Rhodopseudomonas thermotolerans]SSW89439.1 TRAP-type mannitol/chloroaromatic compound transport system permease small subunit [Rhodopseudomonas pentothenatexigens]
MLSFARAITRLNYWVAMIAAWLIAPIFLLLMADVIMRYVVGSAAIWTAELAQLVFGVYAVIAGGYLLAERAHVNVDIIYGRFSPAQKAKVDLATSFLFFLFMAVLIWQGTDMAWESAAKFETSSSIWNPPIWPVKIAIPVAGVLLLLQGLVRIVSDVRTVMGLPNDPDAFGKQAADGPSH